MVGGTTIQTDEKLSRVSLMYSHLLSWNNPSHANAINWFMIGDGLTEFFGSNTQPTDRIVLPWTMTSGIYMGNIH